MIAKAWILGAILLVTGSAVGQGWIKTYHENLGNPGFPYATKTIDGMLLFTAPKSNTNDPKIIKVDEHGEVVLENQHVSSYDDFNTLGLIGLDDGSFLLLARTKMVVSSLDSRHVTTIVKLDSLANTLWESQIPIGLQTLYYHSPFEATVTSNGDIFVSGFFLELNTNSIGAYLVKLNSQGDLLWEKTYYNSMIGSGGTFNIGHIMVEDGNIILANDLSLIKTDSIGNIIWEKNIGGSTAIRSAAILKDAEGNILFVGVKDNTALKPAIPYAIKINTYGDVIWELEYEEMPNSQFKGIVVAMDNGYYLCGDSEAFVGNYNFFLAKINLDGSLAWRKNYDFSESDFSDEVFQFSDGSVRIIGRIGNFSDAFIAKTTPLGVLFSSSISGNVHNDIENDCEPDSLESDLSGWLVQAKGAFTFSQLSDEFGNFFMSADTGSYTITVAPPGPYWDICNSPTTVNITTFNDTTLIDFPVQAIEDCPYLEVSLTAPFLRRCFDNTYYVQYCNYGTVPAADAYIEVTLDTFLTYQSSTIPLVSQTGNTLTFNLDTVAINECGTFQITAFLSCDSTILGQTHCSEAHIFPDSLCLPPSVLWDGSSIEVDVECVGDSIIFNIQNTGTGGMTQPLDYIIIEDQIVLLQGDFQLGAGETMSVSVFASGSTFHLEAEQSPEHPTGVTSTGATIEGCGGWFSLGFFTQFSDPDASPFVDIDCQQNIGSYDPNDKQASPVGFGDDHLIEPDTDIEYLIRFQNTGTDTAFKVVIVDVLPAELDLATLRPGASSHAYEYSVSPEGWPIFTFNNIMLPDSNVNEAASHGFVRFKISQKEGNGHGTHIENMALIYFDFNSPIQTNTVLHKVGQIFHWTLVDTETAMLSQPQLRIMPNPLTDSALLQLENTEPGLLQLLLVTPAGQVVRAETAFGTGFEIYRGELAAGLYFFKIKKDGMHVGSGKLMIR